jgi:hypothetical protein
MTAQRPFAWLGALTDYSASARGMGEALAQDGLDDPSHVNACATVLGRGPEPLLRRAADADAVASDVTAADGSVRERGHVRRHAGLGRRA